MSDPTHQLAIGLLIGLCAGLLAGIIGGLAIAAARIGTSDPWPDPAEIEKP